MTYFTQDDTDVAGRQRAILRSLERLRGDGVVDEESEGRFRINPLIEIVVSAEKLREVNDWLAAQNMAEGDHQ